LCNYADRGNQSTISRVSARNNEECRREHERNQINQAGIAWNNCYSYGLRPLCD
jgi:hypothetical protein